MTKVLVFGSFDYLHEGHKYLFREAKKLGDELYVVVARDSTIMKVKGKKPRFNENDRLRYVQSISDVHKAVLGNPGDKLKVIEEIKPDIIALGYDQKVFTENLEEKLKNRGLKVKIIRIKSYKPEKFKSSLMKNE